jgi:hypothetical protein
VSERFPIEIEFRGIDDVSDELKAINEGMKNVSDTMGKVSDSAFKVRASTDDVNAALKRNKITTIESADAAAEILRTSQANQKAFRAVAEQAEVFSDKAEFMASQLGKIASLGSKVNSIYNSINTMMTRMNTAQTSLNMAQERQAQLLEEINRKFGIQATSVDEAIGALEELRGYYLEGERDTKDLDAALKQLIQSQQEVSKASQEVANAQAQATQQMVALGIQAIGLVPSFIQAANAFSTLIQLGPGISGALKMVSGGFTTLYASLGPVGLILIALSVIIPLIIMYWDQISAALQQAANVIWSVIGPALQWLWDNILKPLADFIIGIFINYLNQLKTAWDYVSVGINALRDALLWVWNNVLMPIADFLINKFKSDIEAWIGAFEWAKQQIKNIFNAIQNIINGVLNWINDKINWIKNQIQNAFDSLKKVLVGGSIIPDMWTGVVDWTKWGINEMSSLMNNMGLEMSPTVRGPVMLTVSVNVAGTNASPEEIAKAVSREILLRLREIGA